MVKLFNYLKPYKVAITTIVVLLFFQALAQLYLPTLMADIVDIGIINGDTNYILRVGGLMLLVAAVGAILTILAVYLSAQTATGFGKDLRRKVFSRVENFSLFEFDQIGTASLITRTTNDITQVQQLVLMLLRVMVSAPLMAIGGIIMAVSKDPQLSLVMVVAIPVITVGTWLTANKAVSLFKAMQIKLDRLNLVLREKLTGIRVIRAFNQIEHEQKKFDEASSDLTDTAIKVTRLMAALMPAMMLVMNLTTVAILWVGGIRVNLGSLQVGDLMAFIQYVMLIMFSLLMAAMIFLMIPRASASAVRINEVLEILSEIKDPEQPQKDIDSRGLVEFEDVTFSYPGAERPLLSKISFTAHHGEVTAIIGGTGSGKSTLINLIPRFYDIDSGSIRINGVNIREMSQADLRAKIGFIPQTPILFSGTINENICFGKEDATAEEVRQAAEIAQATEFITNLEAGFAAEVSQGGTNLSGGQKQRLSIARALVRRPEIYVFDDSFSALDFKTDAKLRMALKEVTAEATVIVVAQRVSTIMHADQIVVLDNGQIAGIGTHQELLKTSRVYREIVASQLSEEELA